MRFRLLALLGLVMGYAAPARAQESLAIPPGLRGLRSREVVEQVLNDKADLALFEDQVTRLAAWHERVATA